jgi:hypothetical protein
LRAQHTREEEENHCRTDDQLEHKSDDYRLHLAPYARRAIIPSHVAAIRLSSIA